VKERLLGFYRGWKVRKIMASHFVENAISQYTEYRKFLAETEMDQSISEIMKLAFR
jgi:hypothetical protein